MSYSLAGLEILLQALGVIVKTKKGFEVQSKKGKKLGGPYKTRKEAVKRLQQVEHFKKGK